MNKIYQLLEEIKDLLKDSGQKIDSVSNSNVANNVERQTNITIISNTSVSKKINKDTVSFKAFSLANYGQIWTLLRNVALILLVVVFVSLFFISVSVGQEEKAILIFFLSIGILCAFLILYTFIYVGVKVNNEYLEIKGKKYQFGDIRKIKFFRNFFYFGRHIKIYLEDDTYPSATLYINDIQMDLIEEFYLDYLKKEKEE